jgi:ubiquinone/menaquinone biosynthesis C-methylase UbiE
MSDSPSDINLLFQSESHPLVTEEFETIEEYCLFLIHTYPYEYGAQLAQNKKVLDLGCNCGYGTNILARKCPAIDGVDVSHRAIEIARKGSKRANLRFQVVDGRTLPFPDQCFDMVTSFQVIEHVKDLGPFINEIIRVLRPLQKAQTRNCPTPKMRTATLYGTVTQ